MQIRCENICALEEQSNLRIRCENIYALEAEWKVQLGVCVYVSMLVSI
jgi:hypothetical protein